MIQVFSYFVVWVIVVASSLSSTTTLRIGARASPLAKIQAQAVKSALMKQKIPLNIEISEINTSGDTQVVGGSMVVGTATLAAQIVDFTGALDRALRESEIDAVVHSLKDIPLCSRWNNNSEEKLKIASCLAREDPNDVIICLEEHASHLSSTIRTLPRKTRLGTSSARRQAQILALNPDLELVNVRGNVEARLEALRKGELDALLLASAGLDRLVRRQPEILQGFHYQKISCEEILPAACQGIVGVAIRASDAVTYDVCFRINDNDASLAASAERSFLNTLDSFRPPNSSWQGRPPLAAVMEKGNSDDQWIFRGLLARPDGAKVLRSDWKGSCNTVEKAKEIGEGCGANLLEQAGEDFFV